MQVWCCPETKQEFLILVGGHCHVKLADMRPLRLCLATWQWVEAPQPPLRRSQPLIPPRQAAACFHASASWLLIHGGWPVIVRRCPLAPF